MPDLPAAARLGAPPVRPTARGAALLAAGIAALVAARGFGTAALAPLGVGFVVLAVGALVLTGFASRGVTATRILRPPRPRAGEPAEATVAVRGGRGALTAMRLLEWEADAGLAALGPQRAVRAGDGVTRILIPAARRGDHTLPPLALRIGDSLGLAVAVRRTGPAAERVLVVPEALPAADTTAALGGHQRGRLSLAGEDVSSLEGLREYRSGDPLSRVHWGQSAKRGRLHTKVFRPDDGGGRIATVLLDASAQAGASAEDRELAVVAAASIARSVATGGGRAVSVGLWLGDEGVARESPWPEAESRLARMRFAAAAPALHDVLHRAARLLQPGSGLVAVTSDPDEAVGEAARAVRRAGIDLVLLLAGVRAAAFPAPAGVPTVRAADRATLQAVLAPRGRARAVARA
ncbi:MAG: DUF58 domain-containing protein [Thermoleophilia bacterium]|nr:DUF58 domain-containing protein [Thermoleophilia bacterium]